MSARILRGAWGALLLAEPGWLLELAGGRNTAGIRVAMRALGARHLAETLILARARRGRPRHWIQLIDAAHGLSMLALAAASRPMRRDALMSAASATALIVLSLNER